MKATEQQTKTLIKIDEYMPIHLSLERGNITVGRACEWITEKVQSRIETKKGMSAEEIENDIRKYFDSKGMAVSGVEIWELGKMVGNLIDLKTYELSKHNEQLESRLDSLADVLPENEKTALDVYVECCNSSIPDTSFELGILVVKSFMSGRAFEIEKRSEEVQSQDKCIKGLKEIINMSTEEMVQDLALRLINGVLTTKSE